MPDLTGPIGMIGLGNMGGRMSRRLADAGWVVHAFDVKPEEEPPAAPFLSSASVS